MKKILVIDDEEAIRDLVELVLRRESFQVRTAEDGAEGLSELDAFQPDLVLLDLMLPDCSGYDLCKEIVKRQAVPVILVSAKNEIIDKVLGLELGAEDYVTKPFDNRELVARIKVVLRRQEGADPSPPNGSGRVQVGELTVDLEAKAVLKNGAPVSETAKEFKLLETLAGRPGKVFTRDELLELVWGFDYLEPPPSR